MKKNNYKLLSGLIAMALACLNANATAGQTSSTWVGDTTGNKIVNSTDVSQTKLQSGVVVSQANCRQDVTANGVINSSDVSLVKLRSGSGLP